MDTRSEKFFSAVKAENFAAIKKMIQSGSITANSILRDAEDPEYDSDVLPNELLSYKIRAVASRQHTPVANDLYDCLDLLLKSSHEHRPMWMLRSISHNAAVSLNAQFLRLLFDEEYREDIPEVLIEDTTRQTVAAGAPRNRPEETLRYIECLQVFMEFGGTASDLFRRVYERFRTGVPAKVMAYLLRNDAFDADDPDYQEFKRIVMRDNSPTGAYPFVDTLRFYVERQTVSLPYWKAGLLPDWKLAYRPKAKEAQA